jgi:phosphate transport system substrate-binding protein
MKTNWRSLASLMLVLALFAAACAGDDTADTATDTTVEEPADDTATDAAEEMTEEEMTEEEMTEEEAAEGGELSGQVNIDGSSTVGPLSEVAAEAYQAENPGVTVSVGISGTGGGFERFCIGETDASNASREISDEEAALCDENGIGYDFVTVGNDALSVIVNPELGVDCMTTDQINQIWRSEDPAQTWGDVEGLEVSDEIAAEEILAYGPGTDSGTFDFFTDEINGESGDIRDDFINIGEDDQAAVNAVSGDTFAIGYTPFSFAEEAGDSITAIAVDSGDGCVEPTLETVQDFTYTPLGRGLFVYFSDTALERPEVLDFATFYVQNAPELAEVAGFISLIPEQVEEAQAKIDELSGS